MIRLNLVVEGQTEETFVRDVLTPELSPRNIFPSVRCVETSESKGYIFRGGGKSYANWKKDLTKWMKQDRHPEVWFTTMIDLYRLPRDFPGYEECGKIRDPQQRVACLEKHWQQD